jgi:cytoskeleton protein RodZ
MAKEKNPNTSFQDLKGKREKMGFSLKDVFLQTRISVTYLEAIENSDFHLLPLPIYARNFINTYARFLGIDGKLILARYEDYLSSLKILDVSPADNTERQTFWRVIFRHSTVLGVVSFLMVIACVIWLISMQHEPAPDNMKISKESSIDYSSMVSTTDQQINATGSLNEKAANNSAPTLNEFGKEPQYPSPPPKPVEPIPPTKASAQKDTTEDESMQQTNYKPNRLIIRATEDTWIRIKADRKPSFQVLLKPGEKVEYKAAIFDMDIGNAGGVKIQFQDKNIENLGNSGEVIRLRLP